MNQKEIKKLKSKRNLFRILNLLVVVILSIITYVKLSYEKRLNNDKEKLVHIQQQILKINNYQNSMLSSVLKDFQSDMNKFGIHEDFLLKFEQTKILVSKNLFGSQGLCTEDKEIIISNKIFKDSYIHIKTIIYHELGHCLFDYAHSGQGIMSYNENVLSKSHLENFFLNKNQLKLREIPTSLFGKIKEVYTNDMSLFPDHKILINLKYLALVIALLLIGFTFIYDILLSIKIFKLKQISKDLE